MWKNGLLTILARVKYKYVCQKRNVSNSYPNYLLAYETQPANKQLDDSESYSVQTTPSRSIRNSESWIRRCIYIQRFKLLHS
jgi:hypothetical protein